MIFDALYITDDETDAGTRQIVAASLADAKAILKSQIDAEATHGAYRLDALVETLTSFAARTAART